uniref:Secreted protein n=1 Tax=Lactuca sativa TaxID=4236 RepID=A0A9R1UWG7_LACSA|nr:hypothetical protein LSAT_V11C800425220 [Lactuca sativa]
MNAIGMRHFLRFFYLLSPALVAIFGKPLFSKQNGNCGHSTTFFCVSFIVRAILNCTSGSDYFGNNLVERTYESDVNGNKFNTRVHTIRC